MTDYRTPRRSHLSQVIRIERLEEDADKVDVAFESWEKRFIRLEEKIGRQYGLIISLVLSLATASILLALNLIVGR